MAYSDIEFYKEQYHGFLDLPDEDMERILAHASLMVDMAVRFQVRDFDLLPDFAKRQIRLATCAMADYVHEQRGEVASVLRVAKSYSIGDVSVTGANNEQTLGAFGLTMEAYHYLLPTGLLNRRVL